MLHTSRQLAPVTPSGTPDVSPKMLNLQPAKTCGVQISEKRNAVQRKVEHPVTNLARAHVKTSDARQPAEVSGSFPMEPVFF